MTKPEFLDKLVALCAQETGFYTTDIQAREQRIVWPTIAQRNANPLRIRKWGSFPVIDGCAKFPGPEVADWFEVAYAIGQCIEGWKSAVRLLDRNVFERRLSLRALFVGQGTIPGAFPGLQVLGDPVESAKAVLAGLEATGTIDDFISVLFEHC